MIATYLGLVQFCALVAAAAALFGRLLKARAPSLPKRALPLIVIAFAFVAVVADALMGGSDVLTAVKLAAWGVLSGAVAVGGHETAKALLEPIVGTELTLLLLGKLGEKVRK